MGNVAAEIFVLLLGGTAVLSLVVSSVTDCWRQDAKDPHSSVGLSSRCRGLWSECVFDNMANLWTCDIPVSYLNDHPASFIIARAMMVVQGVFCIVALPILIIGMKCTTFVNKKCHKSRFSISSGILFLLGGLSGGVASFWYAVDTVLKYRLQCKEQEELPKTEVEKETMKGSVLVPEDHAATVAETLGSSRKTSGASGGHLRQP
ncbi:hypothetical protein NDU88_008958 [Pleurodeles waltl]|uniref:Claudin n=1 Tax=Pleurodeles waltl TaxID=8319 RepID=A0AAV7QU15_PLEWA|nr:hypothetical protein NDU88_008958 [Pleurodeles waltl]